MAYTGAKEIHYQYKGIKYHTEKKELVEYTDIKVDGKYYRSLFGKTDEFLGTIKVGDKVFNYSNTPMKFNEYKMTSIEEANEHYGMIYINDMFKKITIDVHMNKGNGVYSSSNWLISGPCINRKEAVSISDYLIRNVK
ncbi:hypothetical protein [Desulfotomaculum sp. 1211_IL3151]|uniref:hypothetical protein n=1 Tax=Desulfotomaculum sp. 1211_IL3151 TaxID=3084055 RepID=UPI002FD898D0